MNCHTVQWASDQTGRGFRPPPPENAPSRETKDVLLRTTTEVYRERSAVPISTWSVRFAAWQVNVIQRINTLLNPQPNELRRLPQVLQMFPVSRSAWWAGVRSGRYPQPVRISARCVAWRGTDIDALIKSLT